MFWQSMLSSATAFALNCSRDYNDNAARWTGLIILIPRHSTPTLPRPPLRDRSGQAPIPHTCALEAENPAVIVCHVRINRLTAT